METFATRLSDRIALRKTTQAELARKAGISSSAVSDWIRGVTSADNVKAEPLLRAAAFLEVSPMWLLTGRGLSAVGSATVLIAEQPKGSYSVWPFERISSEKYFTLPAHLRTSIEMMIEGVMLGMASKTNPATAE